MNVFTAVRDSPFFYKSKPLISTQKDLCVLSIAVYRKFCVGMFESAHCNMKREKETVKPNEDDEKLVVMQQEACRFLKSVLVFIMTGQFSVYSCFYHKYKPNRQVPAC